MRTAEKFAYDEVKYTELLYVGRSKMCARHAAEPKRFGFQFPSKIHELHFEF